MALRKHGAQLETIASVDEGFEIALADGLFRSEHDEHFVTHDAFESAGELLETVCGGATPRSPPALPSGYTPAHRPTRSAKTFA